MEQIRLKNSSDLYFDIAWKLYEEAFPIEERRLLDAQACLMKKTDYHFDIIIHEKQLVGLLLWWDFETQIFIDHFACAIHQRNKGFGTLILEKFMDSHNQSVLLEVELPNSIINQRRIKFYENMGFKLCQHYYEMPPLIEGQAPVPLLLMSYPTPLSSEDVEQFIKKCQSIIFNV